HGDAQYLPCLFSQPIVELCLQIPTYVLTYGGWDRAAARDAFAADIPREIARRRSKGGQGRYTLDLMERNVDAVRDLLLNGRLVDEGLLSRPKLEEVLSGRPSKVLKGTVRLRRYLMTEVWLRVCERHLDLSTRRANERSAA